MIITAFIHLSCMMVDEERCQFVFLLEKMKHIGYKTETRINLQLVIS